MAIALRIIGLSIAVIQLGIIIDSYFILHEHNPFAIFMSIIFFIAAGMFTIMSFTVKQ